MSEAESPVVLSVPGTEVGRKEDNSLTPSQTTITVERKMLNIAIKSHIFSFF